MSEEVKTMIDEFNEYTAYFFIDMIGGILWRTNHDASHGRLDITPETQKGMEEMREQQVYCVQQLTKFGIDPESAKDRPDGDYWKWFEHWHKWHHGMSAEQWLTVNSKLERNEDISEYLPKNKWNEKLVE